MKTKIHIKNSPYVNKTGKPIHSHIKSNSQSPKYQDVFEDALVELAEENEDIVAITPAMPSRSSLWPMMNRFPSRSFDVGIAEQHAVTFAAGLATQDRKSTR